MPCSPERLPNQKQKKLAQSIHVLLALRTEGQAPTIEWWSSGLPGGTKPSTPYAVMSCATSLCFVTVFRPSPQEGGTACCPGHKADERQ